MSGNEALEAHHGPWTVAELLARDEHPLRARVELIAGSLVVSPNPPVAHQVISSHLLRQIDSALDTADAPYCVAGAVNVRSDDQLFVPDIVVADAAAVTRETLAVAVDAVLLIVEVVDSVWGSNATVDSLLKPYAYARLGVPHYWRWEASGGKPELIVHQLAGDRYRESARIAGAGSVPLGESLAVEVDVPAVVGDLR